MGYGIWGMGYCRTQVFCGLRIFAVELFANVVKRAFIFDVPIYN